jgi:O-antigen ligase
MKIDFQRFRWRTREKHSRHRRSQRPRKQMDPQELSQRLGSVLLYGTFGLLMFGPIAFGAVEPWSIFILEAGSLALLLTWFAKQWVDHELVIHWNPLFLPMAGFGILVILQLALKTSAYWHDTFSGALLYCSYAMLCFLAGQVLIRSSPARKIAVILTLFGFAVAALALLQGIAPNGKLYWIRQPRLGGWIYGPYVNHNHYAGLMELLVPIPLVICMTRFAQERERIAAGVAAAIMVGTLFLSGSRGGMLSIVTELTVLAVVVFRERRRLRIAIGMGAFAIVLAGMLTWLGGKELTTRVATISAESKTEISGGMRTSIDRDAIRMFRVKPVLGWGLGTFPTVYPQFRSFYTNFFVNQAHNDYLQLLSEMGLLGFAVMVWYLAIVFWKALPKIGTWTSDVSSAATLACILSCIGILVHSLVDFNLQIPANAALFYVFCTIAAAPPFFQRTRKRKPVTPSNSEELMPASEVV